MNWLKLPSGAVINLDKVLIVHPCGDGKARAYGVDDVQLAITQDDARAILDAVRLAATTHKTFSPAKDYPFLPTVLHPWISTTEGMAACEDALKVTDDKQTGRD